MKDKLKTFFLNHGEKLGFGLVIVMALYVLWGTRWSPYDKTPQQLTAKAREADQQIANSVWPEERRQELIPTKDISARATALRRGIENTQFAFTTEVYSPIYPRSEPILPPKFLTTTFMLADASDFLMEIPAAVEDSALEEDEDAKSEEKETESEIPEELRKAAPRASAGSSGLLGSSASDCGEDLSSLLGCGGLPEDYGQGLGLSSEYMSGGEQTVVKRNGEGYRFVSVRGIIDWAAQKREFARALHLPPNEAARAEPKIHDFEIQRQQATDELNPWEGEWVTLDIENSVDVLMKAIDFEADIVDVTVTNPVITEPLPRRVLGIWQTHATHPKIENFVLSPEEQALEQMRQQKLIEAWDAYKAANPQPEPLQPGGFGRYMQDIRGMQNELSMSGNSEYMESFNNEYMEEMSRFNTMPGRGFGGGPGAPRPGAPAIAGSPGGLLSSARSAASGRLLLFRYFDFDVVPGAVYRYRVRIIYENPNFGKPIELLASPELAEGQTRTSDWSEPTPPVQVRPEADFYLAGVEYERVQQADVAVMDLYKWNAPTGTVVNQLMRNEVGDEIGGLIKTKVVNPLDQTYDAQDIKVNTGDLLIDLRNQANLEIDENLPDLGKVPSGVRYDAALVMNSNGNLQTYDRFTRESERGIARRFQKFQDDIGKEYEEAAQKALDASDLLEGYGEGSDCGEGGGYMNMMGPGGRRPSAAGSTRRNRRSRDRSGGCS